MFTDGLAKTLESVLADIGLYHTKKLELLRLKLNQTRETAPPAERRQWVKRLKAMYRNEANMEELWVDMFLRLLKKTQKK